MRLLVCGAIAPFCDWRDVAAHIPSGDVVLIHTGLHVVDHAAHELGLAVVSFPSNVAIDGNQRGSFLRRCYRAIRAGRPTHGLAFGPLLKRAGSTQTTGTGDMVKVLRRAVIPVQWVAEPGASAIALEPLAARETR